MQVFSPIDGNNTTYKPSPYCLEPIGSWWFRWRYPTHMGRTSNRLHRYRSIAMPSLWQTPHLCWQSVWKPERTQVTFWYRRQRLHHSSCFTATRIAPAGLGILESWNIGEQQEQSFISFKIHHSTIPWAKRTLHYVDTIQKDPLPMYILCSGMAYSTTPYFAVWEVFRNQKGTALCLGVPCLRATHRQAWLPCLPAIALAQARRAGRCGYPWNL